MGGLKRPEIFSTQQLDRMVNEVLPADAKPGEKVIVATVDQDGAKVLVSWKLKEHWEIVAAAKHEWSGRRSVGAKVVMRW